MSLGYYGLAVAYTNLLLGHRTCRSEWVEGGMESIRPSVLGNCGFGYHRRTNTRFSNAKIREKAAAPKIDQIIGKACPPT